EPARHAEAKVGWSRAHVDDHDRSGDGRRHERRHPRSRPVTLTEYLEALPADPTDDSSPSLIVAEGMLTPAQRKQVVGDTYARRPFAVIAGLPRSRPMRLHNHRARYSGGVDVFLHHPSDTLGKPPDGEALAHLQALLARAGDSVTE